MLPPSAPGLGRTDLGDTSTQEPQQGSAGPSPAGSPHKPLAGGSDRALLPPGDTGYCPYPKEEEQALKTLARGQKGPPAWV